MSLTFETLPNEVTNMILEQLPLFQQRQGLSRVSWLWNALRKGSAIDARFISIVKNIQQDFPFLSDMGDSNLDQLKLLYEKERAIFSILAKWKNMPVDILRRQSLTAIFNGPGLDAVRLQGKVLSKTQKEFLREFAVATDVTPLGEDTDKEKVCILAAEVGNIEVLKRFSKECSPEIVDTAFVSTAGYGQVSCLQYLCEQYGAQLSDEKKELLFRKVVEYNHLPCLKYLTAQFGNEISVESKASIEDETKPGSLCQDYLRQAWESSLLVYGAVNAPLISKKRKHMDDDGEEIEVEIISKRRSMRPDR